MAVLLSSALLSVFAFAVEPLQQTGDPSNRIDMVIMGDGYRDIDQNQLTQNATAFVNELFAWDPFGVYRQMFNIKLVHTISNETGADRGSYGEVRDTLLGATFYCFDIDRLLCVDNGAVLAVAAEDVPEFDVVLVVVNDPMYGGAGGTVGTFSTHPDAPIVAIHELGHTLTRLADEYDDAYPSYPQCGADCPEANVTTTAALAALKWAEWVAPATPIPTPEGDPLYADTVGAFEGARYLATGLFRPKDSCMMRVLRAPFCDICREASIESFYVSVSPIDAVSPAEPDVLVANCQSVTLTATPVPIAPAPTVSWWVDGVNTGQTGAVFSARAELGAGQHTVEARVVDETPWVRGAAPLLQDTATWNVTVTPDVCAPDAAPPDARVDAALGPDGGSGAVGEGGGCCHSANPASSLFLAGLTWLLARRQRRDRKR